MTTTYILTVLVGGGAGLVGLGFLLRPELDHFHPIALYGLRTGMILGATQLTLGAVLLLLRL
jgi:hypothetical protein